MKHTNEIVAKGNQPLWVISILAEHINEDVHVNVWTKEDFYEDEFEYVKDLELGETTKLDIDGRTIVVTRIS